MEFAKGLVSKSVELGYQGFSAIDENTHIADDMYIIPYVIKQAVVHASNVARGRVSYWYIFEKAVFNYPNKLALVYPRVNPGHTGDDAYILEKYTFQELYDIILRLSEILAHRYGVKENDTIGIDATNKPIFIFLWYALWNLGATPAFINFNTIGNPLVHSIKVANISQVFIEPDAAGPIKETQDDITKELPNVQLHFLNEDELLQEILDPNSLKFRPTTRRSQDHDWGTAALIYTSGTTGLPKPAIMSWRKAGLGSSLYGHIVRIKPESIVFTSMPLYHSTAAVLGVCTTFNQAAAVALSPKFSASKLWTQVKLTKATHLQYVGEVCRYLLNSPIHPDEKNHNLQVAYGNGLRRDIWKEFKDRFGIDAIGEFYAATESPIALTSFQKGDYGIGACRNYGKLINYILSYQQTLIKMDPEDSSIEYRNSKGFCERTKAGESGELIMKLFWAKNPETVFQGYLGNKKETESKIIRNVFKKGDAWFRSGDLLKSDSNGLYFFVDRLGDTFRWKSENVSATEVENQFFDKINEISQVVVVGVRIPNHEGRAGSAVIELKPNTIKSKDEILKEIYNSLKQELPKYAIPIFIEFVDKIRESDNHKIPKKQYRDQKLPKGENGDKVIYWLNKGKYEELTQNDWDDITNGKIKL
ncbi:Very long-chain fatty acid transport protein [Wickerhamomyces ciferrii]|uniref:Very long-chain fatty acid transport protein n=1 Tax=Wickerhamomyces ciferrii (strain ATCC 14091 / BCRC 22168 / CBS 111 / JCM 3599 / NBRC 0793 / NRRL Y-1031 F-60-10) TaxID=1206466 RepID=K0KM35_WICCF|nr:Very long-chain fatty acid transport protein [Wickerhamomyces ciferrii]CCH46295.1 Very long-chain fatty acid transport protein [Wickerhamomyces ciferrii]